MQEESSAANNAVSRPPKPTDMFCYRWRGNFALQPAYDYSTLSQLRGYGIPRHQEKRIRHTLASIPDELDLLPVLKASFEMVRRCFLPEGEPASAEQSSRRVVNILDLPVELFWKIAETSSPASVIILGLTCRKLHGML